ncbi:MAG: NAD(P)-dependent oxidoreductase [Desulfohalobiaceae bacterium]|nr:NAD(P)-dependent oxidoreductase [Desulfohalobiaceae bacterium]
MQQEVGFMGMGIMGGAMAANLVRAGYSVTVYNRSRDKCGELEEMGARVADSPAQMARECGTVIAMLTGPQALEEVLFGREGAVAEFGENTLFTNMSSVSPAFSRELAGRLQSSGCRFVDAPVSGSKKPAEEGSLVILAGGESTDVEALRPLFEVMGKKVVHCGPVGQGSMMKMAVNLLLGTMMEGLAEMLNLGRQGGLDTDSLLEVVTSGPLNCGLFQIKESMLREEEYPAQFPLKHMSKDLKFVLDTAYEEGASLPTAHAVSQTYATARNLGHGDQDFAAVLSALQRLNAKH